MVAIIHSFALGFAKVPTGRVAVDDLPIIHMAAISCGWRADLSPAINRTWNFL